MKLTTWLKYQWGPYKPHVRYIYGYMPYVRLSVSPYTWQSTPKPDIKLTVPLHCWQSSQKPNMRSSISLYGWQISRKPNTSSPCNENGHETHMIPHLTYDSQIRSTLGSQHVHEFNFMHITLYIIYKFHAYLMSPTCALQWAHVGLIYTLFV